LCWVRTILRNSKPLAVCYTINNVLKQISETQICLPLFQKLKDNIIIIIKGENVYISLSQVTKKPSHKWVITTHTKS